MPLKASPRAVAYVMTVRPTRRRTAAAKRRFGCGPVGHKIDGSKNGYRKCFYCKNIRSNPLFCPEKHRQEIIRLIPNHNLRILDLCCGTGDQLKKLSDAGFNHLTGVDLSTEMLKVARKAIKLKICWKAMCRTQGCLVKVLISSSFHLQFMKNLPGCNIICWRKQAPVGS